MNAPATRLYAIDVSFPQLKDAAEFAFLNDLPTSFVLPPDAVDRLRAAAGTILLDSPDFQRLLKDIGAKVVTDPAKPIAGTEGGGAEVAAAVAGGTRAAAIGRRARREIRTPRAPDRHDYEDSALSVSAPGPERRNVRPCRPKRRSFASAVSVARKPCTSDSRRRAATRARR